MAKHHQSNQPATPRRTVRHSVLWIWHAAVVAEYQKPLDELGKRGDLEVSLLVPRRWPERAGQMVEVERLPDPHFSLIAARTLFTGFYYIYFFPSLPAHLLRLRPDVIYCYEEAHTFMAALVLLLRRLFLPRSRVLLYAAQNIEKHYPLPFRLFERYCFRHADAILACGATVAHTLRRKGYRGPLRVVPLPTDTAAFSPQPELGKARRRELGIPAGALVVGYAGKLVEEKGLHALWRAFTEVAQEYPQAHLLAAGGGPLKAELQEAARAAGLENRLILPGVVHNADLPSFMNAMDIFVLPSETRHNWREQFGRVAVEAMACGLPVVGSSSGEIPTVLGDAGLIFPEGDAGVLAAHLRTLLGSEEKRLRRGEQGRKRASHLFSLEKVAAQHYRQYRFVHED